MKNLDELTPYSVLFVDAMNLLVCSHYGLAMLEHKGRKTGMLMGALRLIVDWRRRNPGIRIVFVWEGGKSWRKEEYPIYKAQRKSSSDAAASAEFFDSLGRVKAALPIAGVDQVRAATYEADDTVWTVLKQESGKLLFCSTDWDWWALGDYGDVLYQGDVLTASELTAKFARKFGCDPIPLDRLWVFKVLAGDASDNVSGIPRFPRKLAATLAADTAIGPDGLVSGMERLGESGWAEKTRQNLWVLQRNLRLIRPDPPSVESLEWQLGAYDARAFVDVLDANGLDSLRDRVAG